jgi:hypothetical protein
MTKPLLAAQVVSGRAIWGGPLALALNRYVVGKRPPGFAEREVMERPLARRSFRLRPRELHHLRPFVSIVSDKSL